MSDWEVVEFYADNPVKGMAVGDKPSMVTLMEAGLSLRLESNRGVRWIRAQKPASGGRHGPYLCVILMQAQPETEET